MPDSPDEPAQCLLIGLLHDGCTPLQDFLLGKQHELRRATQNQRDIERRARRKRVPQKAGKAAFDGGAVCGVHSNPGH